MRLNNRKKVYQYDLNGNYIRSFDSMKEASEYGVSHSYVYNIRNNTSRTNIIKGLR